MMMPHGELAAQTKPNTPSWGPRHSEQEESSAVPRSWQEKQGTRIGDLYEVSESNRS
jgi:hypothetical protein